MNLIQSLKEGLRIATATRDVLRENEATVDRINQKQEQMMATAQQFKDAFDAIDLETTRIATRVQELLDQIANGGLTPAEEQAVLDQANAELDKLKAIGTNPPA